MTPRASAQPAEPPPDAEPPPAAEPVPEGPPAAEAAAEAPPAAPASQPAPAAPEPAPEPLPVPEPAPGAAATPAPDPAAAPAAPALPLSVTGSFWTRYELRRGYHDHGLTTNARLHREGDYLVSRARLTVKTTPLDIGNDMKASATFAPQAAYTMGETGTTPANTTVGDQPPVTLYEGYASVGGSTARVDAGRFMMDYGDSFIIGNLNWNELGRSFNGARLHITPSESPLYIDVFGTLIHEGRTVTTDVVQGDVYFWGVYAGLGPALGEGIDLDAYFLGQSTARNENVALTDPMDPMNTALGEVEPTTDLTLGARLKGKTSLVDYRLETGIQFGKSPVNPTFTNQDPEALDKFAYQADAELGINPAKGFRLAVEGLYASGNNPDTLDKDEGWNQLYPTAHKWLGWADIVGARTNIMSGVLHVLYAPIEPLKLSVDAFYFKRPEMPPGKEGAMGSEIDSQILYALGGGASVRGMYAVFLPNEDYWESATVSAENAEKAMHYFEMQFGYDFK
ncbi:MAG TPA: alginate export family protein [Polyangiaceae bacterium]